MPAETDRYVRRFTAQVRNSGVSQAVICPGSRSTPLTLALTGDPAFTCWLHLDERSAGYFALGMARQRGEPVVLVCTSGTAAANFLPAVMEASLSRVPLLVLTADRPPELRDVGAAQTVDQVRLYGSHARWAVDMPLPGGGEAVELHAERHAARTAARAVEVASGPPAGPVHLNFPFREPLVEVPPEGTSEAPEPPPALPDGGGGPPLSPPAAAPAPETVAAVAAAIEGRSGIIVCGPETGGLPADKIVALGRALGWPVLADPLSGVRVGPHDLDSVVETYDTLLREPEIAASLAPEAVLRFGAAPTSKALNQWLAALPDVPQYVVDVAGGWRDPDATAAAMVRSGAALFCDALIDRVRRPAAAGAPWAARWREANRVAREALREALDAIDEPFEGRAPVELAEALPDGATLVAGNSMAVRDVDSFLPALARSVRIVGNRGASGIDGVVSSAVGAAAAGGGPVALLIGDLSFFHDLNGLWPVRRNDLALTVLLVHNDGGGIFHFLPQAEAVPDRFEQWFGTPHGLDFRGAVEMHGGRYEALTGSRGWAAPLAAALASPGLSVLELRTERRRNVELHRQVLDHVHRALRSAAGAAP